MPGVFIGSTELTTVGDIKIGGTDVQEVYVGSTKVFPVGGGGFEPTDIAGLQFWFDASDASTFTLETGDKVSEWRDKSGNSNDVTQTVDAQRPTRTTDGGLDVLESFANNTVLFTTSATLSSFTASTIYLVGRAPSSPNNNNHWFSLPSNNDYGFSAQSSAPDGIRYLLNSAAGLAELKFTISNRFWVRGTHTDTVRLDIEDNLGGTTPDTSIGSVPSFSSIYIFNRGTGFAGVTALIHEVLLYDSVLSSGDQTSVQDYLNNKWSI